MRCPWLNDRNGKIPVVSTPGIGGMMARAPVAMIN